MWGSDGCLSPAHKPWMPEPPTRSGRNPSVLVQAAGAVPMHSPQIWGCRGEGPVVVLPGEGWIPGFSD